MNFEEGILVESIQNFSCIWNTKDKEHRNSLVVENAWRTIATIMGQSVETCQDVWKSLRAKYVRERKLVTTMPSGSAAYTGNWPLYKSMSFLAPVIQTRRTSGNIPSKTTSKETPLQMPSCSLWATMVVGDDGSLSQEPSEFDHPLEQAESSQQGYDEIVEDEIIPSQVDHSIRSNLVTPTRSGTPSETGSQKAGSKRYKFAQSSSVDKLVQECFRTCNKISHLRF